VFVCAEAGLVARQKSPMRKQECRFFFLLLKVWLVVRGILQLEIDFCHYQVGCEIQIAHFKFLNSGQALLFGSEGTSENSPTFLTPETRMGTI
jgi:hypothetical protein